MWRGGCRSDISVLRPFRLGAPSPPCRLRPDRPRRPHVREHARTSAPCLPRDPRLALDAGVVSGKNRL